METYRIGLDIGYLDTKAVANGRRVCFPSVVGDVVEARVSLHAPNGRIILDGPEQVLVGRGAVLQSVHPERREDRGWIQGREWYLLALAALSEIIQEPYAEVQLCVGLPLDFWEDREIVRGRLRGDHELQRRGRKIQALRVLECRVVPQPWGTLLSMALDPHGGVVDEGLLSGLAGVVDGGGHTTNLQTVHMSEEIWRQSFSLERGGWDLVRALRAWLASECPGLALRDHEIDEAIRRRVVEYYGEPVDIGPIVDDAAEALSREIVGAMTQTWGTGANLRRVLLGGGLMIHCGEFIMREFPKAQLALTSAHQDLQALRFCVAQGYYNLLQYQQA